MGVTWSRSTTIKDASFLQGAIVVSREIRFLVETRGKIQVKKL